MFEEADYTEETKELTDEELLDQLEYCGYDRYYQKLYRTTLNEIRSRMKRSLRVPEGNTKQGKWEIYVISPFDGEGCRCSLCGTEGTPSFNFCPGCGADMRA